MPKFKSREETVAFLRDVVETPILALVLGNTELRVGLAIESPAALVAYLDSAVKTVRDELWKFQRALNGKADPGESDADRAGREFAVLKARHRAQSGLIGLISLLVEASEQVGLSGRNEIEGVEARAAGLRERIERDERDRESDPCDCLNCSSKGGPGSQSDLLAMFEAAFGPGTALVPESALAEAVAADRRLRTN